MSEHHRPCWIEIDLEAIERNYVEAVRRAGPNRSVIASIKGNAYGHGVSKIVSALNRQGAVIYWTGHVDEATALRREGVNNKIIMFGGYLPSSIPRLIAEKLIPTIYDPEGADAVAAVANGNALSVYVKVDSGLGRLGVPVSEAEDFILKLAKKPGLAIEGVYTHLPFRDLSGKNWALGCASKFADLLDRLKRRGVAPEVTQLWGSSGLLADLPDSCNTVCIGHLLYGLSPVLPEVATAGDFQPAFTAMKARLIHVGHHAAGADLAIGSSYQIKNARVTGVLGIGTGDGMRRAIPGKKIEVLVHGKRAPVIGVSLEHTVLDLTNVDDPRVGDEVVLIGASGADKISLSDWGEWLGVGALEVILNFSGRASQQYANPADNIWGRFASAGPS